MATFVHVHAATYGQNVTLDFENASLSDVLNEIQKQTGYDFLYNSSLIKGRNTITIKTKNTDLKRVLADVLSPQKLSFEIDKKSVLITKKKVSQLVEVRESSPINKEIQTRTITGKVTDEEGMPLSGATISLKGTTVGTSTDEDGNYSISVSTEDKVLIFSSVGYVPQEIVIERQTVMNVVLQDQVGDLDEVVVTALGIRREEKSLGYAVQKVQGASIQTAKEPNLLSNLTGKIAGLNIQNPPGLFEDPRISLRGSSDILVVVDNVPVETNFWNLSPDDIEEMSVLKGPAAAALYGSRGQNGAILITTKKGGGKDGKIEVAINSSSMFQSGFVYMPETQSLYGSGEWGKYHWADGAGAGTYDGDSYAWGPKLDQRDPSTQSGFMEIEQWDSPIDPVTNKRIPTPFVSRGKDNVNNFFQNGHILSNNVALGASTERTNYRFSLTQMDQKGIDPNTKVDATTIAFSGGHTFSDKFSVESSVNYNKQYSDNYPRTSYYSDNNMYNILVWMPSDIDVRGLKDYWETGQEGVRQRNFNYSYYNNPYFIANEYLQEYKKDVVYGFASLSYQFNPELRLTYRSNINWNTRYRAEKRPKGFVGYSADYRNGGFYPDYTYNFELNNEFLLTYDKTFNEGWSVNAVVGGNNRTNNYRSMSISASALSIPGVYNIGNAAVPITGTNSTSEKLVNSLYGSANIGYRNGLFLTLTGRNDWSSGMPVKHNSYFYPSVSFSGVLSEFITMPEYISQVKLRSAWIRVGGDMSPYSSQASYSYGPIWGSTPTLYLGGTLYPDNIEPDFKNTIEMGGDFRFFENRLGFDVTYFEDTFSNMITTSDISVPSGYTSRLINSDKKTRRKGWEATLSATPVKTSDFNWEINLNWSRLRDYLITAESGKEGRDGYVKEGEMYGDWIFRNEFDRSPDGEVVYRNGFPVRSSGNSNLGFGEHKWFGGFTSNFRYKNWFLSFSVDGRWGGLLYSRLNQKLWESGKHKDSAIELYRDADSNGEKAFVGQGVSVVSGEVQYDSEGFVVSDNRVFESNETPVYYRDWVNSYYNQAIYESSVFDASFLKLREVVFSYTLPKNALKGLFIQDAEISFIGRNLFLWTKDESNMDPDMKGAAGESRLYVPTPRNIGFNLKLKF